MLTLLASVAIAQSQWGSFYGHPDDAEPYVGGFLQEVCGLKVMKDEVLGLYKYHYFQVISPTTGLDTGAREPYEVRVGYMGHKVVNDLRGGNPVLRFESDGLRTFFKAFEVGEYRTVFQRARRTWLDLNGHILRDEHRIRTPRGAYEVVAEFKGSEIELVWRSPRGERELTLMPAEGVAAFEREFEPMVEGEKVLKKEKTFLRLDPETGGYEKVIIRIPGRFKGRALNKQYVGHSVEYITSKRTLTAYITYEGKLLQVDLPRNHFLFAEVVPEENEVGLKRLERIGG